MLQSQNIFLCFIWFSCFVYKILSKSMSITHQNNCIIKIITSTIFNPIHDGLFWGCSPSWIGLITSCFDSSSLSIFMIKTFSNLFFVKEHANRIWKPFVSQIFFFYNSFCFSVVQLSFCVCVYNLYRCSSKKTCRWYLLFLWKTTLTTIVTLWTSIIFFKGKLSSEWNLIFIYFSSESTEFFVIDLFI